MAERTRVVRATAGLAVAVALTACAGAPTTSTAGDTGARTSGEPGMTAAAQDRPGRAVDPGHAAADRRPERAVRRQATRDREAAERAIRRVQVACGAVVEATATPASGAGAPDRASVDRARRSLDRCVDGLRRLRTALDAADGDDGPGDRLERALATATQLRSALERAARPAPPPDDHAEADVAPRTARLARQLDDLVGDLAPPR